jgi:two-component system invasion response regulator UvrY
MNGEPLKVLLIDDHPVVLAGYRRLLEAAPDMQVVAEARTGEEGYFAYLEHNPDVVVLDLALPGRSGLDTLGRILKRDPAAKILVVSIHDSETFVRRSRDGGAKGFLDKRSAAPVLFEALRQVGRGESYFPESARDAAAQSDVAARLSPREFEVFRLLAEGYPIAQIAATLNISPKTAGVHQTRIMNKLRLDNVAQLTRLAIRDGIVRP